MRFATIKDLATLEAICNRPELRVWTAFDGAPLYTLSDYLIPPSFVVLGDEGCFPMQHLEGGRFLMHANLLPEFRGARAVELCTAAINMAFSRDDVHELVAAIPHAIPQSIWMARHLGFHRGQTAANVWPARGMLFDLTAFTLSRQQWRGRTHLEMEA